MDKWVKNKSNQLRQQASELRTKIEALETGSGTHYELAVNVTNIALEYEEIIKALYKEKRKQI